LFSCLFFIYKLYISFLYFSTHNHSASSFCAARPEGAEASFVQHALKGQKLLAQGSALGNDGRKPVAL